MGKCLTSRCPRLSGSTLCFDKQSTSLSTRPYFRWRYAIVAISLPHGAENTRHWAIAGSMLGHRLRRSMYRACPDVEPILFQCWSAVLNGNATAVICVYNGTKRSKFQSVNCVDCGSETQRWLMVFGVFTSITTIVECALARYSSQTMSKCWHNVVNIAPNLTQRLDP